MNNENISFSDISSFNNNKVENNFEIIAIEILENAEQLQIKTLNENDIYYLNNAYKIKNDEILYEKSPNIYNINNDLTIHISAIVGKNGTGKSTIVELLFLAINSIAHLAQKDLSVLDETLNCVNLYYKINDVVYKIAFGEKIKYIYTFWDKKYIVKTKSNLLSNIKLEKEFFYTISVNYSQHSLNAKYIGEWLNNLFHKNDAYQTPIVIEPFRKDGNIDVNSQDDLVNSRLLVNLLEPTNQDKSFRKLTEYLEATKLEFEVNADKVQFVFDDIGFNMYGKEYIEKYLKLFFKLNDIEISTSLLNNDSLVDDIISNITLLYIFKKLLNITLTYKQYKKYHYYLQKGLIYKFENHKEYFVNIMNDKSHVTYKLRQAINFLKFRHIEQDKMTSLENLSIRIGKILEGNPDEKIEFMLPPSFLETKIILKTINEQEVLFSTLSSGEKQKIYSINSIMYHLSNLDSVIESFDKKLLSYKNINIVLDEIELYFHPEMQREYISYLIETVELLKDNGRLENIESLNFIFVTHSPFILSDIVQNNVLFLDKDEYDEKTKIAKGTKTFGANIHDLLKDGFFISNSIGAYAKKQVDEIIRYHSKIKQKELHEDRKEYLKQRDKFVYIVDSLGEPYIKGILQSYIEDMDKTYKYTNIDEEIYQLQERLKLLKKKKNNNG